MTEDNELIEHVARAIVASLRKNGEYVRVHDDDLTDVTLDGWFDLIDVTRDAVSAYRNHEVEL